MIPPESPADAADHDIAIRLRNVRKEFPITRGSALNLIRYHLMPWSKPQTGETTFVAVDSIDMDIRRGEVVGIIGSNGSGKTTLLKMIAGLLRPTSGEIWVNGRVTTLLAMGVGVNPEFSGRENIFFTGLLLGMTKSEIREKMDSIIDFAEIGEFIDEPLKTYSSGMRARLLFSAALSVDPEIMIIDEALATGDAYFIHKCMRRIREICSSGATILFVSHSQRQIEELCDYAYLFDHGSLLASGAALAVIERYNRLIFDKEKAALRLKHDLPPGMTSGTADVVIDRIVMRDHTGTANCAFLSLTPLEVNLYYTSHLPPGTGVEVFLGFLSGPQMTYIGLYRPDIFSPYADDAPHLLLDERGVITLRLDPLMLASGEFTLWLIIHSSTREKTVFCEYKGVSPFIVSRQDRGATDRWGYFLQPGTLHHGPHDCRHL